jgi:hypothetical protein
MPSGVYQHQVVDPVERFFRHVEPEPNSGCWLWIGALLPTGYGVFCPEGTRTVRAHRFAFLRIANREIPPGTELDHLCRVRCCVNPAHLEAVTRQANFLRGQHPTAVRRLKNECKYGHSMADAYQDRRGRACRTCGLERYHRVGYAQRKRRLSA